MDAPVIEVAIGMVFTFAVVAALSAVLSELIARFLGLRARFLLLGLRELLDGNDAEVIELGEADTTFDKFRSLVLPPTVWADWAKRAAKQAPDIPDWPAWMHTATAQAKALAPTASPDQRTRWAEAAREDAIREADRRHPDWDAWAHRAADEGRRLVANPDKPTSATAAVLGSPIMRTQGMAGAITDRSKVTIEKKEPTRAGLARIKIGGLPAWLGHNPLRGLPSYVSARTFSAAVIDLVVPDADGKTTLDQVRAAVAGIDGFPALTQPLQGFLKTSEQSVAKFRESVEGWYDDHMDRVSGWYKRHMAKWSLALGAILVVLLNVNSLDIATTLYRDHDARIAVAAIATDATHCDDKEGTALTNCLDQYQQMLADAQAAGLPIGWPLVPECRADPSKCPFWQQRGFLAIDNDVWDWRPLLVILGWLITVVALVPGARFWFDLLAKLGSLRTTGPKPAETKD